MFVAAGILIFLADVWAVTRTVRSTAPRKSKILWVSLVLLLPFVGMVMWIIFGPS